MAKKKTVAVDEPESSEDTGDETTTVITPDVCVDHEDNSYFIDVEMPGVAKEQVELSIGEQSLCVEAARGEVVYLAVLR